MYVDLTMSNNNDVNSNTDANSNASDNSESPCWVFTREGMDLLNMYARSDPQGGFRTALNRLLAAWIRNNDEEEECYMILSSDFDDLDRNLINSEWQTYLWRTYIDPQFREEREAQEANAKK